MTRALALVVEQWPLKNVFRISRGAKQVAEVVLVTLSEQGCSGRGEGVPYARYGESVASVMAQIESVRERLETGMDRQALLDQLPAGAARNACDCALWELEARQQQLPVWQLAGLAAPGSVTTAYTLGVDSAAAMAAKAREESLRPLLKLKMSGGDDLARVAAVRAAAPEADIIVDANEGWSADQFVSFSQSLAELKVSLIEQPLPVEADSVLAELEHPVPVCADESCHTSADLDRLQGLYEYINIKLDKTGGLTEALVLREQALARGFGIMVGCMVSTSLAMAPASLVAQGAAYVDLDGPLLLAQDRQPGLVYDVSRVDPPSSALWG